MNTSEPKQDTSPAAPVPGLRAWMHRTLFQQVDGSSLAVFRMGFGLIMLVESLRFLYFKCIECFWVEPEFLFKYYGFAWVEPLSEQGMQGLFWAMAVLSTGIMVGFCYRLCMVLFTLAFTWIFLLGQSYYLNHFYMVILFGVLLCLVPAHRKWSLDARLWRNVGTTVPAWSLLVLVLQLEVILIHAGLAKLNWDWLNLEPLRMWLRYRADMPFFGALFVQEWSVALAAYGVIALHLVGAPLLMVRATRLFVLGVYAAFHTLNHFVFNIGIFPWFTLFASLLCFDPQWPLQVRDRIFGMLGRTTQQWSPPRLAVPAVGNARLWLVALLLGAWVSAQALVPLRHWLYPGDVAWNEEGHRFSWRMKLRSKPGSAFFVVRGADGSQWLADPANWLNRRQLGVMACRPDMILQFAHYMADEARKTGLSDVAVFADVHCSLNGRPLAPLVDSSVDLTKVQRHLGHNDWVLPLTAPMQDPFLRVHK